MINILVTGVGSLIGQGIIRSIKYSSLKYRLIGTDYFKHAVGLYWVEKGYILPNILNPRVQARKWVKKTTDILKKEKIDIVLIGLDFELDLFAKYQEEIESTTAAKIIVSPRKIIKTCDKWETVNFLKSQNLPYPESCLPEKFDEFLVTHDYPFVVKPRFGGRSKNLFVVNNPEELKYAISNCKQPIIQEFIGDMEHEFTCGSLFYNGEVLSNISLRRILKDGNTYRAFSQDYHDIDNFVVHVTKCLKQYGPANFQLRVTEKGPTIFEINPRFSGTTAIRAMLGINEVEIMIKAIVLNETIKKSTKKTGVVLRYFEDQFISWEQYEAYRQK